MWNRHETRTGLDDTPLYHRTGAVEEGAVPVAGDTLSTVTPLRSDTVTQVVEPDVDAPIVIDLPDGQKVLLGELSPGTVIEIAAWRGTERLDSRTTRIVLGVAHNETYSEGNDMTSPNPYAKPRRSRAWIWWVSALGVVAIGIVALLLSPLTFVHPTTGTQLGFGPADASVAVVSPLDKPVLGQMVIAKKNDDVIVGQVAGLDSGQVLLQTGTTYTQVATSQVFGNVVALIPFVGLVM